MILKIDDNIEEYKSLAIFHAAFPDEKKLYSAS